MKPLTPSKRPPAVAKAAPVETAKKAPPAPRRQAQCCAKTTRSAVGCHD